MGKVFQLTILIVTISAYGYNSPAQDLGSSNKLFGGKASEKPVTTKKSSVKPKVSSKKASKKASKSANAVNRTAVPAVRTGKDVPQTKSSTVGVSPKTTIDPSNENVFTALIADGDRAHNDRDYARAEAAFRRAIATRPGDYRGHYGLGTIYADQLRWGAAETAFRTALQIDPKIAITNIALSYVLTQPVSAPDILSRYEEAEKFARAALVIQPRNAVALNMLGVARELRGLVDLETERSFRQAIETSPEFAPAYADLGRLLRRQGRVNDSASAFDTAVRKAGDPASMVSVAQTLQSVQRFSDSIALLKKALALEPKNPAALLFLGRALMTTGAFADAEVILKKATEVTVGGVSGLSELSELYIRVHKLEKAEASLLNAGRYAEGFDRFGLARLFEALGDEYLKNGSRVPAVRVYQKAKELNPDLTTISAKIERAKSKN
ncbi:MAG: tetratricopeptide repeat protein [Chloracidobacterium sp.]|nr:tetratricopeptide repeat protein [Chloracidobacterium sp.]